MACLAYFLSVLFVGFIPTMCLVVPRIVPLSEMPNLTNSMLAEIDASIEAMNNNAAKFVPQVKELFEKLNTSAVRGSADIKNSLDTTVVAFQSDIAKLYANVNSTDARECEDYVTPVKSAVPMLIRALQSCVNEVLNEADQRIALTLAYMDSKLDSLAEVQRNASKCTENIKGTESSESQVRETYNCVKQIKGRVDYSSEVLASTINFMTMSVLYRGWAKRVGCCTTMSEAESFKYATELYYSEAESCVSKAASS